MNEFSASETDDIVQITITFGIEGVNRDGTTRWDPEEYGVIVWDDSFDMSSNEAQEALMRICEDTRASSLVYSEEFVTCPIEDFKNYLNATGEVFPYSESESGSGKSFGQQYYEFMESSYGIDTTSGTLSYIELSDDNEYIQRFYAMYIYTKLQWSDNSDTSRDDRDRWDNWIDEFSEDCPDCVCGHILNVGFRWCWLDSQRAFIQSAIQGISLLSHTFCAFIFLSVVTKNQNFHARTIHNK